MYCEEAQYIFFKVCPKTDVYTVIYSDNALSELFTFTDCGQKMHFYLCLYISLNYNGQQNRSTMSSFLKYRMSISYIMTVTHIMH